MMLLRRFFSTTHRTNVKVSVLGAAGGIGQPLALLLKLNPLVTELYLYDIVPHTPGVGADISHIDTNSYTKAAKGPEEVAEALCGAELVVIPAGVPRKPGMTRDDLFDTNASIVRDLMEFVCKFCPKAVITIVTNPVNSCLPIAAQVMKKNKVFDPNRLIGVTTLDIVRSSTFVASIKGMDPTKLKIPVVCGHSGETIVPLISHCKPKVDLSKDEIVCVIKRIQNAGTEVVKAKAGAGSATLSMAYSGARFVGAVLRGMTGESNVIECSMVAHDYCGLNYFAGPLLLGKNGVEKKFGLPDEISDFENELVKIALPILKKNIKRGEDFDNCGSELSSPLGPFDPLQKAAIEGDAGAAESVLVHMLKKKLNINERDGEGMTPLQWAAIRGHEDVLKKLLVFEADVHSLDYGNFTALHLSVISGKPEAVRVLLQHGSEVNAVNLDGDTPLHLAVKKGDFDIVETLLEHGAFTNISNCKGKYALDLAIEEQHLAIVKLLKSVRAIGEDSTAVLEDHFRVNTSYIGDLFHWANDVQANNIPEDAVIGGTDPLCNFIYVGRASHGNHLLPAKVCPTKQFAYYSLGGSEYYTKKYQVGMNLRHF
ncbi:unnamed protein product [Nezara viridula]|uniref:Malate dehydrogenase, mitochondrial n=1 Tax=Nezara viridula TaxID=85310 RepID=A0A9P0H7W4_NEZVI|nr:unnamed protein product [Nezara viridula]